jgi:hypothetical protein
MIFIQSSKYLILSHALTSPCSINNLIIISTIFRAESRNGTTIKTLGLVKPWSLNSLKQAFRNQIVLWWSHITKDLPSDVFVNTNVEPTQFNRKLCACTKKYFILKGKPATFNETKSTFPACDQNIIKDKRHA